MVKKMENEWKGNITNHLSPYFHQSSNTIDSETDPLISFIMESGYCTLDPEIGPNKKAANDTKTYCPMSTFRESYFSFVNKSKFAGSKKPTWSKTVYDSAFNKFGLLYKKELVRHYRGNNIKGAFVLGIDISE